MSFIVDLRSQVTQYAAHQPNWGGAACCWMAMSAYPSGGPQCNVSTDESSTDPTKITQTRIWNYIQTHNKEPGYNPSQWDYGWWADPYAVTKALNDLCPPQYSWIDVSDTDKNKVLYRLLRYMANYNYPALISTYNYGYWTLLVYYETSDDPRNVTNPQLIKIGYYYPRLGAVDYKEVDGATWMVAPAYWGAPCDQTNSSGESLCGNIWNNHWIGIGEPPEVEGSVQVESIVRAGEVRISPTEAIKIAQEFLTSPRGERPLILSQPLSSFKPFEPMLVRELPFEATGSSVEQAQRTEEAVRYYIVPFTSYLPSGCIGIFVKLWRKLLGQGEQRQSENMAGGAPLTSLSVFVNAHTGRIEGLSEFSQPVR